MIDLATFEGIGIFKVTEGHGCASCIAGGLEPLQETIRDVSRETSQGSLAMSLCQTCFTLLDVEVILANKAHG